MKRILLYVHGQGGSAEEAAFYQSFLPQYEVVGIDYRSEEPAMAMAEIATACASFFGAGREVSLLANSIGAYFSMLALPQMPLRHAFFLSPVVDMETLILRMMQWAQVDETTLQKQGEIATAFGQTLSWAYLSFVRSHPLQWRTPTSILYGGRDHLIEHATVAQFAQKQQARLRVIAEAEHWFHTQEQLAWVQEWLCAEFAMEDRNATGMA